MASAPDKQSREQKEKMNKWILAINARAAAGLMSRK